MKDHGTRVIIYNLWEDDQGQLELDFDADPHVCLITEDCHPPSSKILCMSKYHRNFDTFMVLCQDIQIRGVNRDEKNIQMAKEFPNSRHFLTYRHSLRVNEDDYYYY